MFRSKSPMHLLTDSDSGWGAVDCNGHSYRYMFSDRQSDLTDDPSIKLVSRLE